MHPQTREAYVTLTNNVLRGKVPDQPIDAANPRRENHHGQIVRWREADNGRKRKYYSIKKDGAKALNDQREQWVTVSSVFKQLWRHQYV